MSTNSSSVAGVATIPRADQTALIRQVSGTGLYNRQLSSICQVNGLKSTGVKAVLQKRLTDYIQETVVKNDVARFYQIKQSIANATAMPGQSSPSKPAPSRSAQPPSHTTGHAYDAHSHSNGYTQPGAYMATFGQNSGHGGSNSSSISSAVSFKQSPFYEIKFQVGAIQQCPAMAQHRSTVQILIRLTEHPFLQKCVDDPSYKIMLFCAAEGSGPQDIAFPHQSELKINGGDFKANLRGLKNKPGSTRPVDITSALRLKASYTNNVEFTYALTHKKYLLVVYVCRVKGPTELTKEIATRRKIPKESVIAELNKKAQDPDVVATSQILSLKCPLSYSRLQIPCRGLQCTHIQCFDGTSYLQLQEQGPQWLCPICNKAAPFEHLAVDEYVRDILDKTSESLETVTIEPNGRWSAKSNESDRRQSTNADFDDVEDLEISEVTSLGGPRVAVSKTPTPSINTPTSASRNTTAPRGLGSTSTKRPASAVIDLTLSSDEEDDQPIQRPAKRQAFNGYRDTSERLGFLSESPNNNSYN